MTKDNASQLTMDVVTNSKGTTTTCSGIGDIFAKREKEYDQTPICLRIIGNITASDMSGQLLGEKGTLQLKGKNNLAQNITIEGIGEDATCNGWGILLNKIGNVEVRNLGVMLFQDDGISLKTCHNTWIHNIDFFYGGVGSDSDQAKGDGSMDVKDKSTYVTFSYNHFWDSGKSSLCGMSSETNDCKLTYHHNWFDHSDSRHPRVRTMTVHVYNNYFDGNAKYGVGATMGASVFVENNYFRNCNDTMMISGQGTDAQGDGTFSGETGGMIKSYGNKMVGTYKYITQKDDATEFDAYETSTRDEQVPSTVKTVSGGNTYNNFDTASTMYEYNVDTPDAAVTNVKKYSGRINGGNFKWIFNEADDTNYDVDTELKNALLAYDGTPVYVESSTQSPNNPSIPEDTTEWTTTTTADFASMTVGTEPTTNGLYYTISDADSSGTTDSTKNNISISNGKLNINDTSTDTTKGYYMFEPLTGSKTKITISLTGLKNSGKWSFITLINSNGDNIVFRTQDKTKKIGYFLGEAPSSGEPTLVVGNVISSSETISILVDRGANKTTLEYAGTTAELVGIYDIKGFMFQTAGSATDRSFVVSGVTFNTLS